MKGWVDLPSLADLSKKVADDWARDFAEVHRVPTRSIRKPHGWLPPSIPEVLVEPRVQEPVEEPVCAWVPDHEARAQRKHSKRLRKLGHSRPTRYDRLMAAIEQLNFPEPLS